MKKLVLVLLFCFIAVGLIFGCTQTNAPSNPSNPNGGTPNGGTVGNNTGTNGNAGTSGTIPQPPALPE